MAHAMLFPEQGGVGGRGKKDPAKTSKSLGGFRVVSQFEFSFSSEAANDPITHSQNCNKDNASE